MTVRQRSRQTTARAYRIALVAAWVALVATSVAAQDAVPPIGLRFGLGTGLQNVSFALDEPGIRTGNLTATPNTPLYLALGTSWRSIGIGLRLNLPGTLEESEARGTTDFTNVQLQLYGRRYAADLVFQRHEGMYIENGSDFDVPITDIRIPDLSVRTLGASLFWSRNPNVNLATAYKFDTPPQRSRIGLVWMAAVSNIVIDAPSGPASGIPALAGTIWSESMQIQTHSAIAGAGFTTILTGASLFFAPLVTVGLGAQRSEYSVANDDGVQWSIVPQLSGRLSLGYNNPNWYLVGLITVDARNMQTPFLEATQGSVLIELLFGRRIGRPEWELPLGLPTDSPEQGQNKRGIPNRVTDTRTSKTDS